MGLPLVVVLVLVLSAPGWPDFRLAFPQCLLGAPDGSSQRWSGTGGRVAWGCLPPLQQWFAVSRGWIKQRSAGVKDHATCPWVYASEAWPQQKLAGCACPHITGVFAPSEGVPGGARNCSAAGGFLVEKRQPVLCLIQQWRMFSSEKPTPDLAVFCYLRNPLTWRRYARFVRICATGKLLLRPCFGRIHPWTRRVDLHARRLLLHLNLTHNALVLVRKKASPCLLPPGP